MFPAASVATALTVALVLASSATSHSRKLAASGRAWSTVDQDLLDFTVIGGRAAHLDAAVGYSAHGRDDRARRRAIVGPTGSAACSPGIAVGLAVKTPGRLTPFTVIRP